MDKGGVVQLAIADLTFFSPRDEENLFAWLASVSAIEEIKGSGDSIYLRVATSLGDDDLMELISIFSATASTWRSCRFSMASDFPG